MGQIAGLSSAISVPYTRDPAPGSSISDHKGQQYPEIATQESPVAGRGLHVQQWACLTQKVALATWGCSLPVEWEMTFLCRSETALPAPRKCQAVQGLAPGQSQTESQKENPASQCC